MRTNNQVPFAEGNYLLDGGMETTLIYHYGMDLPHFSAFDLLRYEEGREAITRYYRPYFDIARKHGLSFILETPTWRANPDWLYKLGYDNEDVYTVNLYAVEFMRDMQQKYAPASSHILLGGQMGPRGDGYAPTNIMSVAEAQACHTPQLQAFAQANVDLATVLTLNYSNEAIGIVKAAEDVGLPIVVSFTLETDGNLPSGETLKAAIERTDQETAGYPAYFMINCAHPEHFKHVLQEDGVWKHRIRALRANASTKSHAELDASDTLDAGDKALLARGYQELTELLPELKVYGGCCGTDHSHLQEISRALFTPVALAA